MHGGDSRPACRAVPDRVDRAGVRSGAQRGGRVSALRWMVVGGACAVVALLSPLTVWFALVIVPIVACTTRGLEGGERRWVVGLTALAVALRVAVVVALFL